MYYPLFLLQFFICTDLVFGHGRLIVPPARSSAWREDDKRFPKFYDDNQMYCGGAFQLRNNGGRCGICGENVNGVSRFEKGGSLYTGISVRHYQRGQIIDVKVYLSANHLGWTEFRICNVDNMATDATHECLDKTLLPDLSGQTRIPIKGGVYNFETQLRLPADLVCNQCVFQWKYHTGNSWNKDPTTGVACLGCGPQEEFYGCADVTIADSAAAATPVTQSQSSTQSIKTAITPAVAVAVATAPTKAVPKDIAAATLPNMHIIPIEYETRPTYAYSKKVIYNPIANKIEIILYKNKSNIIDSSTKRFEVVPNGRMISVPLSTATPSITQTVQPQPPSTTTTVATSTTTSPVMATKAVNKEEPCYNGDGYYADLSTECKEYYVCLFMGTPTARVIRLRCPDDLYFEPRLKICHLKDSVVCDAQQ